MAAISDPLGGARTGRKLAAEAQLPGRGAPLPEWASPAVFGDSEDSPREYWRRVKGWKGCMKLEGRALAPGNGPRLGPG